MRDQRKTDRTRTYLGGQIVFNQRSSVMDCLVRNFSSEGAKLVFSNTVTVPDEFDLSIPKQERTFRVRMVWRRADEAGVAICGTQARPAPVPLDLVRRLRSCEAERAALEKRVAQLCSAE
jgi:PilZ domain